MEIIKLHIFIGIILDVGFIPATIMLIISGTALACLKSVRNIIAPPVVIVTDCKEISFAFPTRFKSKVSLYNRFFSLKISILFGF